MASKKLCGKCIMQTYIIFQHTDEMFSSTLPAKEKYLGIIKFKDRLHRD